MKREKKFAYKILIEHCWLDDSAFERTLQLLFQYETFKNRSLFSVNPQNLNNAFILQTTINKIEKKRASCLNKNCESVHFTASTAIAKYAATAHLVNTMAYLRVTAAEASSNGRSDG